MTTIDPFYFIFFEKCKNSFSYTTTTSGLCTLFSSFSFCNFPRRETRRYSLNNKPTQMTAQLLLDPRRFDLSLKKKKHSAAGFFTQHSFGMLFLFLSSSSLSKTLCAFIMGCAPLISLYTLFTCACVSSPRRSEKYCSMFLTCSYLSRDYPKRE